MLYPRTINIINMGPKRVDFMISSFRYGLVVRIAGSHPAGPGSIPGNGRQLLNFRIVEIEVAM